MPALTASNPTLKRVGSHTVSLGHNFGDHGVQKEECYPKLTAEWRGKVYDIEMSADRYVHSEGWSEWRIYVVQAREADSDSLERALGQHDATDTARRALGEVCRPLVIDWLNSDAYRQSRQRAFAWMIRNEIREERYNADRPAATLNRYHDELSAEDRDRLHEAIGHARRLIELLDA